MKWSLSISNNCILGFCCTTGGGKMLDVLIFYMMLIGCSCFKAQLSSPQVVCKISAKLLGTDTAGFNLWLHQHLQLSHSVVLPLRFFPHGPPSASSPLRVCFAWQQPPPWWRGWRPVWTRGRWTTASSAWTLTPWPVRTDRCVCSFFPSVIQPTRLVLLITYPLPLLFTQPHLQLPVISNTPFPVH